MTPDVEAVLIAYLLDHADVAAIVGSRVASRTPRTLDDPWVRVTLVVDEPERKSSALHLLHAHMQIDCYAGEPHDGSQAEASTLARTVREALHAMPSASSAETVVSAVTGLSIHPQPDDTLNPARERYIVQGVVHCHGTTPGS